MGKDNSNELYEKALAYFTELKDMRAKVLPSDRVKEDSQMFDVAITAIKEKLN